MADDLCVNIFSLMENLVSTFTANRLSNDSFGHTDGF